jgi:hypothetical protein
MLLIPKFLSNGNLQLDAFSYNVRELDSVANVIHKISIPYETFELKLDKFDRMGRRYLILKNNVRQFVLAIGAPLLRFKSDGDPLLEGEGSIYKCEEINLKGSGGGCIELRAVNDDQATVKCSLVANVNRWMGGVASPGKCR